MTWASCEDSGDEAYSKEVRPLCNKGLRQSKSRMSNQEVWWSRLPLKQGDWGPALESVIGDYNGPPENPAQEWVQRCHQQVSSQTAGYPRVHQGCLTEEHYLDQEQGWCWQGLHEHVKCNWVVIDMFLCFVVMSTKVADLEVDVWWDFKQTMGQIGYKEGVDKLEPYEFHDKKHVEDPVVRAATRWSKPIVRVSSGEGMDSWQTLRFCCVTCGAAQIWPQQPRNWAHCCRQTQRWAGVKSKGRGWLLYCGWSICHSRLVPRPRQREGCKPATNLMTKYWLLRKWPESAW